VVIVTVLSMVVVMVSVMVLETYIVMVGGVAPAVICVVVAVCVGGPITMSLPGSIDGVIGFPSSSILTTVNSELISKSRISI
jgi:hypothetical protein